MAAFLFLLQAIGVYWDAHVDAITDWALSNPEIAFDLKTEGSTGLTMDENHDVSPSRTYLCLDDNCSWLF